MDGEEHREVSGRMSTYQDTEVINNLESRSPASAADLQRFFAAPFSFGKVLLILRNLGRWAGGGVKLHCLLPPWEGEREEGGRAGGGEEGAGREGEGDGGRRERGLWLPCGSLSSRVCLVSRLLMQLFHCSTEAARNHLGACLGGLDEELLLVGGQPFHKPRAFSDLLRLNKQNMFDKYFCCSCDARVSLARVELSELDEVRLSFRPI